LKDIEGLPSERTNNRASRIQTHAYSEHTHLGSVTCFSISYFCEVLQFFLPSRFASWRDVVSNTMGGILGSSCVFVWARSVPPFFLFYELSLQSRGSFSSILYGNGSTSCLKLINNHAIHLANRHLIFITSVGIEKIALAFPPH
jgi:hypothetical protein